MKALPDEEGIETEFSAKVRQPARMKALPDEEGIETGSHLNSSYLQAKYEGTP